MNFLNRIKQLDGVKDVKHSFSTLSLTVYYFVGADLELMKILIMHEIDRAALHQAIEKINFISIDETKKRTTP